MTGSAPLPFALTEEEKAQWKCNGFVGPFTAWTPEEMDALRPRIHAAYQRHSAVFGFDTTRDRHLDSLAIHQAGTHPAIVDRCVELFGDDLVLWRSNLFHKPPGGGEIGVHQGLGFIGIAKPVYSLDPPVNITAWLALTDSTIENGCVQLFPGTHRKIYDMKQSDYRGLFGRTLEMIGLEDIEPIPMEVQRGQFFLFTETVVHGSSGNPTDRDRTGIGYRFTPPSTRVYDDGPIDCRGMPLKRWHTVLVAGEDRYGHNRLGPAPTRDDYPDGPLRRAAGAVRKRWYKRRYGMQEQMGGLRFQ